MFCAIVLSYKRPNNIQRIVNELCSLGDVTRIIVANNNNQLRIRDFLDRESFSGKLVAIDNGANLGCHQRFVLAKALVDEYSHFIFPDDDIFLSRPQYMTVLESYKKSDKRAVMGVVGQTKIFKGQQVFFSSGMKGMNSVLDIINCFYVVSSEIVNRYFAIKGVLGWSDEQMRHVDDVLISLASLQKPACIDVGKIEFCETSDMAGVATWREDSFDSHRLRAYRDIMHSLKENCL